MTFIRRPSRGTISALVVVGLCATGARLATPASAAVAQTLRTQVSGLVAAGAPGAVVLSRRGTHTASLASGVSDVAGRAALTTRESFRIGSLTKTYVAAVVLQLVGEHKLSLSDDVERFLPGVVPGGDAITIRDLLRHTSGLFDFQDDPQVLQPFYAGEFGFEWTPRRLVEIAVSHPPLSAPGASYRYSNTNYVIAGLIIAAVTRKPLETVLRQRIFAPLGLRRTAFQVSTASAAPQVHGYYTVTNPPATDVTGLSPYAWASGAIVSTAGDVAAFYRALLSGHVVSRRLLGQMLTTIGEGPDTDFPGQRYGLGLERYRTPCGTAWGHGGNFPGYLVYSFTSRNGQRQGLVMVNEDPASLPRTVPPLFSRLLIDAYCRTARSL